MPRRPRLDLPGVSQHLIQRGNDRQPCFFADIDRVRYLQDLRELARTHDCQVHAYVLMTNHVHLLLSPARVRVVSALMQSLGRRYVRYFNDRYQRTGTLWEGRYRSCLVDSEDYLLRCYRYIELNPVRAGMVVDPADYPWSSHGANALGHPDPLVQPHPRYLALERDDDTRRAVYRSLVTRGLEPTEVEEIRRAMGTQRALGSDDFREDIQRRLGRRVAPGRPGRPRKQKPKPGSECNFPLESLRTPQASRHEIAL